MYVTNVTKSDNLTDDNNNNCTKSENNIHIFIPSLLLTIPCVLSFLCLKILMAYTLIKPLKNNK